MQVKYIWPTRWSTVKTIYLVNRYGNIVFLALENLQLMGLWRSDSDSVCAPFVYLNLSTTGRSVLTWVYAGSSATIQRWRCHSSSLCHSRPYTVRFIRTPDAVMSSTHRALPTVLVLLRAWATWGRHVRVLAALATMFVVYATVSISMITWGIVSIGGM